MSGQKPLTAGILAPQIYFDSARAEYNSFEMYKIKQINIL